jgi:hypothetical protein
METGSGSDTGLEAVYLALVNFGVFSPPSSQSSVIVCSSAWPQRLKPPGFLYRVTLLDPVTPRLHMSM